MSAAFGQGLPAASGWKRDMTATEKLYTQADLDFFSANADEYFAMANALRVERDHLRETLEEIVGIADDHPFPFTATIIRLAQGVLYGD